MTLLSDLNRSRAQTIVLITHDPEIAASMSRVVRMRDGRIVGGATEPTGHAGEGAEI